MKPTRCSRRSAAFCALALASAAPALAQTDAGSLLNQQQQQKPLPPPRTGPEDLIRAPRPALVAPGGVKVQIKRLRFSGATELLPAEWLQQQAAKAAGQALDFAGLQGLAGRVTDELRARGWMLARAYLPQQDLAAGELEIVLLAGRIDAPAGAGPVQFVTGARGLRLQPEVLQGMAARRLQGHAALNEPALERFMLLLNDVPGVAARARLEPGSQPDSTRIQVDIDEGPQLGGVVWMDNHGSRDTGQAQLNAQVTLNDALGRGEQFSAQLTRTAGTRLGRLNASAPLGPDGLRANMGVTHMSYRMRSGVGAAAGLEGESQIFSAGLSHPWVRSRQRNVYAALGYSSKQLRDDARAGNLRHKRSDTLAATLSGDVFDNLGGGGLSTWNAALTAGELDLGRNSADAEADAQGYRSAGSFQKLNVGLTRTQRLAPNLSLYASLNAQLTRKNLDSSEKFILGGPYAVRAYTGSEAQGDSGWVGTLELRHDWPGGTALGRLQLQAYVDTGRIRLHQDPRGLPISTLSARNSYGLSGAGVGLHLSQPGRYLLRTGLAQAVGRNPGQSPEGRNADGRSSRRQAWVQALWWF